MRTSGANSLSCGESHSKSNNVENHVLTLQGQRTVEHEAQNGQNGYAHYRERAYGTFCRRFTLGAAVDADKITATYCNNTVIRKPAAETDAADKMMMRELGTRLAQSYLREPPLTAGR